MDTMNPLFIFLATNFLILFIKYLLPLQLWQVSRIVLPVFALAVFLIRVFRKQEANKFQETITVSLSAINENEETNVHDKSCRSFEYFGAIPDIRLRLPKPCLQEELVDYY